MERKDKKVKEMPLWIKTTPGTLIITQPRRMRLKPKQRFRATPEELGSRIGEFELLDGDIDVAKFPQFKDEIEVVEKEKFTVRHEGAGWYNVISPTGEICNEKKLRVEDAEQLKSELEEESE